MVTPSSSGRGSFRLFRKWHGWKPLLITLGLLIASVSGFLYWYEPAPRVPKEPDPVGKMATRTPAPLPEIRLHRVEEGKENGNRVLRVVVVEDGEELIIDASSGKLLSVRDKLGKTTWQPPLPTKPMPEIPMKS